MEFNYLLRNVRNKNKEVKKRFFVVSISGSNESDFIQNEKFNKKCFDILNCGCNAGGCCVRC